MYYNDYDIETNKLHVKISIKCYVFIEIMKNKFPLNRSEILGKTLHINEKLQRFRTEGGPKTGGASSQTSLEQQE